MIESRIGIPNQENIVRDPVIEHRTEVVRSMNPFVKEGLKVFTSPERMWQPSHLKADKSQLEDRKKQAAGLSKDVLVVMAAAYITENALPTYQTWLNRIDGVKDETGTDTTPWAVGNRLWTADESKHSPAIRDYMNDSERFDMEKVDIASEYLIIHGFDPMTGKDPYKSIIFVSIQEPATLVSHTNTAIKAKEQGDPDGYKTFILLGSDESRHTSYYHPIFKEIFRLDPEGATIALRDVIESRPDMPGKLMTHNGDVPTSGNSSQLYGQVTEASIRSEIYTPQDYMKIVSNLIKISKVETRSLRGEEANKAQEDIGRINRLYKRGAQRFTPKQFESDTSIAYSLLK